MPRHLLDALEYGSHATARSCSESIVWRCSHTHQHWGAQFARTIEGQSSHFALGLQHKQFSDGLTRPSARKCLQTELAVVF